MQRKRRITRRDESILAAVFAHPGAWDAMLGDDADKALAAAHDNGVRLRELNELREHHGKKIILVGM